MTGGAGDDIYDTDQAGDQTIEPPARNDTVHARVNWTLGGNIEQLVLLGSVVSGNGNGLANTIFGNAAANYLDGKGAADTMHGFDGNDVFRVDASSDVAIETNARPRAASIASMRPSLTCWAPMSSVSCLTVLATSPAPATASTTPWPETPETISSTAKAEETH
ncbi:MAG: hypothetical protein HC855_03030 [Rhizobiales bacterium]|nr:hypothetical protein [Hyphomicrobiales bacterium]